MDRFKVNTRGPKPITSFVGSSLGEDTLTKGGLVKVTPTLQLESHATVFAVGDIVEWKEQKQASKTYAHAAIAAKNIVALTLGQQAQTLYKGSSEMVLVTLGKVCPVLTGSEKAHSNVGFRRGDMDMLVTLEGSRFQVGCVPCSSQRRCL